jgi:hypothetical protein
LTRQASEKGSAAGKFGDRINRMDKIVLVAGLLLKVRLLGDFYLEWVRIPLVHWDD